MRVFRTIWKQVTFCEAIVFLAGEARGDKIFDEDVYMSKVSVKLDVS